MNSCFAQTWNGCALRWGDVPLHPWANVRSETLQRADNGERVCSFFAMPPENADWVELVMVLANDTLGQLFVTRTSVANKTFESLTTALPEVHLFEREIHEQARLKPEGHPSLNPVRFSSPFLAMSQERSNFIPPPVGDIDYYRVEGDEVHEVAVGPVHAGVIEPGHFRLQCHGEKVFHLEISLGYQHRGVEEALPGGPHKLTLRQIETLAGDSSVAHGLAYCQCIEALSVAQVPARAEIIRGIALELERLANHTGDLGALAGDVGFLPTMSFCGRLRGDFLTMTALICGNRFGRSLLVPGGVRFDLERSLIDKLVQQLDAAERDVTGAVKLLFQTPSVAARFENTGVVTRNTAKELGLVGVAARASGLERDVRTTHPFGVYQFNLVPTAFVDDGDVGSRALVRWIEIQRSLHFIRERLAHLPDGPLQKTCNALQPRMLALSLVEGWRGEVCHVAVTREDGCFCRYKVCDASFHNWAGLAMALHGQQISDFPLCNKSFNLSYCGVDL